MMWTVSMWFHRIVGECCHSALWFHRIVGGCHHQTNYTLPQTLTPPHWNVQMKPMACSLMELNILGFKKLQQQVRAGQDRGRGQNVETEDGVHDNGQ